MLKSKLLPIALLTTISLTACETAGGSKAVIAPFGAEGNHAKAVCGTVREWTPEYEKKLAGELSVSPRDSATWTLFRDATDARRANRVCRGE
jgi:hypothetical protein